MIPRCHLRRRLVHSSSSCNSSSRPFRPNTSHKLSHSPVMKIEERLNRRSKDQAGTLILMQIRLSNVSRADVERGQIVIGCHISTPMRRPIDLFFLFCNMEIESRRSGVTPVLVKHCRKRHAREPCWFRHGRSDNGLVTAAPGQRNCEDWLRRTSV